jgi:hypothetical protein
MSIVGIYGFTGRFSGTSEYDWNHPEVGATHQCMLFLRQESELGQFESAVAECLRYGFEAIENMRYGKLVVDALTTEPYRGFSGFYEEAFASGSALVFYPAEARSGGAAT